MKITNLAISILLGSAAVMLASTFHSNMEFYKRDAVASRMQAEIMRDQMADMIYQQRSTRTYADGVRDGVQNSKNADWISGYHACSEQMTESAISSQKGLDTVSKVE